MRKNLKRTIVENGIAEITLNSFVEFVEVNEVFSKDMGLYFRGQRDSSWKLRTSFDRLYETLDKRVNGAYDAVLQEFTKAIRGKTSISKDSQNEDEIWALGQHNGLPTPLLDWTLSSYIALFFAFENSTPSSTGYRTIWGLHRFIKKEMSSYNKNKNKYTEFKFVDPLTDENQRLIAQSGMFIKKPVNFDIEAWIIENYKGIEEKPVMFKLLLPDTERFNILKNLVLMNIHHASIYPDLFGAAKYCMTHLELLSHKSEQMTDMELFNHLTYTSRKTS